METIKASGTSGGNNIGQGGDGYHGIKLRYFNREKVEKSMTQEKSGSDGSKIGSKYGGGGGNGHKLEADDVRTINAVLSEVEREVELYGTSLFTHEDISTIINKLRVKPN